MSTIEPISTLQQDPSNLSAEQALLLLISTLQSGTSSSQSSNNSSNINPSGNNNNNNCNNLFASANANFAVPQQQKSEMTTLTTENQSLQTLIQSASLLQDFISLIPFNQHSHHLNQQQQQTSQQLNHQQQQQQLPPFPQQLIKIPQPQNISSASTVPPSFLNEIKKSSISHPPIIIPSTNRPIPAATATSNSIIAPKLSFMSSLDRSSSASNGTTINEDSSNLKQLSQQQSNNSSSSNSNNNNETEALLCFVKQLEMLEMFMAMNENSESNKSKQVATQANESAQIFQSPKRLTAKHMTPPSTSFSKYTSDGMSNFTQCSSNMSSSSKQQQSSQQQSASQSLSQFNFRGTNLNQIFDIIDNSNANYSTSKNNNNISSTPLPASEVNPSAAPTGARSSSVQSLLSSDEATAATAAAVAAIQEMKNRWDYSQAMLDFLSTYASNHANTASRGLLLSNIDPHAITLQALLTHHSNGALEMSDLLMIQEQKRVERQFKIERYKNKRRNWIRKISYDCRKRVADARLRVKGRFISKKDCEKMKDGSSTNNHSVNLNNSNQQDQECDQNSQCSLSQLPNNDMLIEASEQPLQLMFASSSRHPHNLNMNSSNSSNNNNNNNNHNNIVNISNATDEQRLPSFSDLTSAQALNRSNSTPSIDSTMEKVKKRITKKLPVFIFERKTHKQPQLLRRNPNQLVE